jgi:hypothetical protein
MSAASLGARVRKLQMDGDGQSLEQWAEAFSQGRMELPDHALISLAVWHVIPKRHADAFFDTGLCVEWRSCAESAATPFRDWIKQRGSSVEQLLDDVRRAAQ